MPIEVDSEIRILNRDEFHSLAHRVLGIAFDIHNEFGRLLNESIYKRVIALRCAAAGILPARQEVQITVRFEGFENPYFMDLLFALGLMVELKTVEALTKAHFSQTLHYLMLTALTDGQGRMRDHLRRFLGHTRLACIQWINLSHHDIEFETRMASGGWQNDGGRTMKTNE